jgi:hypothetical protein
MDDVMDLPFSLIGKFALQCGTQSPVHLALAVVLFITAVAV